jgi:hypothetical protein
MAIGRIAGPLLLSNLDRQGIDLQFTTDNSPLLYLDFANFRTAINTTAIGATETLTVNGNALVGDIKLDSSTISSDVDLTFSPVGNVVLGNVSKVQVFGGNVNSVLSTYGNGVMYWQDISSVTSGHIGNLTVTNYTISSLNGITLAPTTNLQISSSTSIIGNLSASGATFSEVSSPVISGNSAAFTGTVSGTFVGNLTGNVIGSAISVSQAVTFNSSGAGGSPGTTYNGSTAQTISYNTVGAQIAGTYVTPTTLDNGTLPASFTTLVTSGNASVGNLSSGGTLTANKVIANTSQTGNIIMSASTVSSLSGTIDFSGSIISNIGYPSHPTDAATVSYVTASISSLQPNAIWQGNSIASITDTGSNGQFSVTIDGTRISSFTQTTANIANLSISSNTISSSDNIVLNPASNTGCVLTSSTTALRLPVGSTAQRPSTPESGYLRFNNSANIIEVFNGTEWISAQAQIDYQILATDGMTKTFSLNYSVLAEDIFVITNGVVQVPSVAYTTLNASITFAEAPLVSDVVIVRFVTQTLPSLATISNGLIVNPTSISVGSTPTLLDSFGVGAYRAAKYLVSVTFSDGNSQLFDILLTQNGTTDAQILVLNTPVTGSSSSTISFSATVSLGICNLLAASPSSGTLAKVQKFYISV